MNSRSRRVAVVKHTKGIFDLHAPRDRGVAVLTLLTVAVVLESWQVIARYFGHASVVTMISAVLSVLGVACLAVAWGMVALVLFKRGRAIGNPSDPAPPQ